MPFPQTIILSCLSFCIFIFKVASSDPRDSLDTRGVKGYPEFDDWMLARDLDDEVYAREVLLKKVFRRVSKGPGSLELEYNGPSPYQVQQRIQDMQESMARLKQAASVSETLNVMESFIKTTGHISTEHIERPKVRINALSTEFFARINRVDKELQEYKRQKDGADLMKVAKEFHNLWKSTAERQIVEEKRGDVHSQRKGGNNGGGATGGGRASGTERARQRHVGDV